MKIGAEMEDDNNRNCNDVGVIGDRRGEDREDKGIRGMNDVICDVDK